jgi:isopentenyl diphosphate isomerase/L-lactate dehydrogenase-like FMN-dependent dehydrogenase
MSSVVHPLSRIVRLADFEPLAREVLATEVYDFIAGGSWDEITLAENVAAWERRRLRPRVLVDVARVSTATTMLGAPCALPLAVAPMASQGDLHPDGELATARAAAAAGVPLILSTVSSRSLEEVAAAAPGATRWFQLYTDADPRRTRETVERAAAAGYAAIVLTVDLPVMGYRERDRRNAFDAPGPWDRAFSVRRGTELEPGTLTWSDVAPIRAWAPDLPLVLKGLLTAEDARLAVEHGVDAIVVSNHGARQLDRVAAPVDVLEEIADAVAGRCEVWADGGVRRGLDIAIALALGARGVLLGRPVLWALAAGGEAGVARALAIVREELEIALALLGTPAPGAVTRAHAG